MRKMFTGVGTQIAKGRRMMRWFIILVPGLMVAFTVLLPQPRAVADDPSVFRVMTMNIQMGSDSDDYYELARVIDTIADIGPDLVGIQEVVRNHVEYRCDDQPALLAEGLRRRTGRPWEHVYRKEWNTQKRECLESGRGDEWETEGLAFLAPEAFVEVAHVKLPHSRIGLMARVASAPEVPVVVTHLASSAANRHQRVSQIEALLPWAEGYGAGILMGDLNAEPNAPELLPILARYGDAWLDASRRGAARGVRSGWTRPDRDSRVDYVMYAPAAALALESVEVVDTSSILRRTEASDHRPVVAVFRRTRTAQ
jgi:endonuclease/exonuclease/phosphatase family metal-dependent hydrolase